MEDTIQVVDQYKPEWLIPEAENMIKKAQINFFQSCIFSWGDGLEHGTIIGRKHDHEGYDVVHGSANQLLDK